MSGKSCEITRSILHLDSKIGSGTREENRVLMDELCCIYQAATSLEQRCLCLQAIKKLGLSDEEQAVTALLMFLKNFDPEEDDDEYVAIDFIKSILDLIGQHQSLLSDNSPVVINRLKSEHFDFKQRDLLQRLKNASKKSYTGPEEKSTSLLIEIIDKII